MNLSTSRTPVDQTVGLVLGVALLGVSVVPGCSVYSDTLLDSAEGGVSTGGAQIANVPSGGTGVSTGGTGAGGTFGIGAEPGAGAAATGGAASGGMTSSGSAPSGGQAPMGGQPQEPEPGVCSIDPLVDPASLPACADLGYADPDDADPCAPGDDCRVSACGFAGLGTKTCTCKADGTFNCSCLRPAAYEGQCPEGADGCTQLNQCVRGPSCLDFDLENTGPSQGTRGAMHGDLCATEWDQCVTLDAPESDGCVCLRVNSSLPEWVCKDRENWFDAL